MSTITQRPVTLPSFDTAAQTREAERQRVADRPGFFQAVGHAVNSEWVSAWGVRAGRRSGFEYDPAFRIDDKIQERLTNGLPEDMWSMFEDAVSMDHAMRIREQAWEIATAREKLESMGWGGTALRIGAAIFDPVAIVAGAATGGAGYLAKGGRVARMIRTGLAVGGSEAAIEGYLASQDPERDAMDVVYAGLGGFVLGGVADRLADGALSAAARKGRKDIEYGDIKAAMGAAARGELTESQREGLRRLNIDFTDEGRAYFREQLSSEDMGRKIDDLIRESGLDPVDDSDIIAEIRSLAPEDAINRFTIPKGAGIAVDAPVSYVPEGASTRIKPADGADAPPPYEPDLKAGDFDPTNIGSDRASFTKVRFGMSALLGKIKSSNGTSIAAGNRLVTDPLLKKGGKVTREAADVWARRKHKAIVAEYARVADPSLKAWARENGVNLAIDSKGRDRFFTEVGHAMRLPPGRYTGDKHVNAVADNMRRLQGKIHALGRRHALGGFNKFEHEDTYLTTVWSPGQVSRAAAKYGSGGEIDDFFYNAVMSQVDGLQLNITPEKARRIGKGLREKLVGLNKYSDLDRDLNLGGSRSDLIEEALKEAGIDAETIQDVLYGLGSKNKDPNLISVAKHRTPLNLNYSQRMSDGEVLKISDLIDNNAERLFDRYAQQVIGGSAAQQVYRSFGVDNFDALARLVVKDMEDAGANKEEIGKAIELLTIADKHVRGIPLSDTTGSAKFLRRLRSANYSILSGGFGAAALAEAGNGLSLANLRAMYQQMPELSKIIKRARTGEFTSDIANDVEALTGLGTEGLTNQLVRRFDESMDVNQDVAGRVDFALHQSAKASSNMSGLRYIDEYTRKGFAMIAAQRLVNMAKGRPMSARRLAALGITEEEWAPIARAIDAEYAANRGLRSEIGITGRRVTKINIDEWQDQQAAGKFVSMMYRMATNTIQTSTIGATHPLLAKSEVAKTLFQFRNFILQAYEKQLLYRIQMHDLEAFSTATGSLMAGGLIYTAQQHALSIGRPDREEFLKERLSDKAIATAAFQRSGWSSLLPSVIDTGAYLTQRDPLFTYGNTGLSRGIFSFDNNASSQLWLKNLPRGIGGMVGAATQGDEEFGQQDARALLTLLPFSRLVGVRNVLEALAQQFPEE